jgi:hypothetical protein
VQPRMRVWLLALLVCGLGLGISSLGGGVLGSTRHLSRQGPTALPLAAQGPVSAVLGRGDPRYRVQGASAFNPGQQLELRFRSAGVMLSSVAGRVLVGMAGFGRGRDLRRAGLGRVRAAGNRVSYGRGAVGEWFVNGPLGVEQGFDVSRRPAGRGAMRIAVALRGVTRLRLEGRGGALLRLAGGGELRYTGVSAVDALGRALPAWLGVRSGRL